MTPRRHKMAGDGRLPLNDIERGRLLRAQQAGDRCCAVWQVPAVVQHCALMPGQSVEARAVFRPGDDVCPECGCKGSTWDDPLRVPAAVTATSVADAWDMLDDRLARERRKGPHA